MAETKHYRQANAFKDWAESRLIVPPGHPLSGEKWQVYPYMMRFVRGFFKCQESGLSIARKNAKSALIASILLAYLDGDSPFNFENWRGGVTSISGEKAKELKRQVEQIAAASGIDVKPYATPTPGRIVGARDSEVTFLNATAYSGQSLGLDVSIIDEGGLLKESERELFDAMYSAISAREGRFSVVSIKGDSPMFLEMQERAKADPNGRHVFFLEYAAREGDDPHLETTWRRANPGMEVGIKSKSYMVSASRRARQSKAAFPTFAAHDLNLPRNPTAELLLELDEWRGCLVPELPAKKGALYCGIDMGGSAALSGLSFYWPETGRAEFYAGVPSVPDLLARGRNDSVGGIYRQMRKEGSLFITQGLVVDASAFLKWARDLVNYPISILGGDRYKKKEVEKAVIDAGIKCKLVFRGRNETGGDIDAFQRAVKRGNLSAKETVLMAHCLKNAEVLYEANGSAKLNKVRLRGRIDPVSAGVIATGLAEDYPIKKRRRRVHIL